MFTIDQFCEKTGLSRVYVHRMLLKGKISGHKEKIPGTDIPRWLIDADELERFENGPRHVQRDDGRNRFILYGTVDEMAELRAMIEENGLTVIIEKQKQYKKS